MDSYFTLQSKWIFIWCEEEPYCPLDSLTTEYKDELDEKNDSAVYEIELKTEKNPSAFEYHERKPKVIQTMKCSFCEKKFRSKFTFKNHLWKVHDMKVRVATIWRDLIFL